MKFEDDSQNVKLRIRIVYVAVLVILVALGARLYYLQVVKGRFYAERAENQRIRLLPIPAPRGAIFDRNGKLLVNSRLIYNVILSRDAMRDIDVLSIIDTLADGLEIDRELLRERIDEFKTLPAFESLKIKENATSADISWVRAHSVEYPYLRIEKEPQRTYMDNGVLAHVIGYVSEISKLQLERPEFKDKGYKPGDIIGQEGLEAVYDQYLRGRDGYRRVVVDSRGHIQNELETVPPQPGQDMVTTIDLDLQLVAEEKLRNSPSKRGVIVAMDPNNGELLVMASYPTFDPNLFSQNTTTKEMRRQKAALFNDPQRALYNRAIRGRYPPGSTWKIPMAAAGLMQGAITIKDSNIACGGGIQTGNKFTRCMGNHGTPELRYAIQKSCDGYFYRLGLKMGVEGIMDMVDTFDLDKKTGVDLPSELTSRTPNYYKPRMDAKGTRWKEVDTVYASFGQVYEYATPLAMLRAVAGIGMGGKLYVPHLMKEFRPVDPIGNDPQSPDYRPLRPQRTFDRPEPKVVQMSDEDHLFVVEGMWNVVNEAGTGAGIRMAGFDIAGKTGTAQVVSLGKDVGGNKDHAWFVSFAPAYKPEISAIALIENVGFGGTHAAPTVRAVYDEFYRKTRHQEPPGALVAKK